MAQGISRGSREAQQFLNISLHSNMHDIQGKGYKERAEFGSNLLLGEDELFHFKKTELKNRAAEDKTHTIEAVEHKAEMILNGLKSSAHSSSMMMHAISSIEKVLSDVKPSEMGAIKNTMLRSLATIKHGVGDTEAALAAFANHVMSNPSYFFTDPKQAKLFVRIFLRSNGLSGVARMLRTRNKRRLETAMRKLTKMAEPFYNSIAPKPDTSRKLPALSAKKQLVQPVVNAPADPLAIEERPIAPPAVNVPVADQNRVVVPAGIPPAPPPPKQVAQVRRVEGPVAHDEISLDGLTRELEELGVNMENPPNIDGLTIEDLERMPAELDGQPDPGNNRQPINNENNAGAQAAGIPPAPELPPGGLFNRPGRPNNGPAANGEGSQPSENASMEENTGPQPGNIPPAPPPPPAPPRANRGVKPEDIKDRNGLVPIKPATKDGPPSVENCTVAPEDISRVQSAVFRELEMDRMLKLKPEHVAHLTAEQQAELSPELIGDLCYKANREGRLSYQQSQETKACRKLLICLDPEVVKAKLQASSNPAHATYLNENTTGGTVSTALDRLYKTIRREDFGLVYENDEAVSRLTPEQLVASANRQAAEAGAGRSSLLDSINQGGFKLRTAADAQNRPEHNGPGAAKNTVAGGAGFNASLLENAQRGQVENQNQNQANQVDILESDEDDWEDEDNRDEDLNINPLANRRNEEAGENANSSAAGEVANNNEANPNQNNEQRAEAPEVKITEEAVKAINISFKLVDIQKNVDIEATVNGSLDAVKRTRAELNMPDLSERELERLEGDLKGIAMIFFRENKEEWLAIAQAAARKEGLKATQAALDLGKTEEEIQNEVNKLAQESAEKALIKHLQDLVEERTNGITQKLTTDKALEDRRKNIYKEDEDDDAVDDWDDDD